MIGYSNTHEIYLDYPQSASLKPSFNSSTKQSGNKNSYPSSIDNFELVFGDDSIIANNHSKAKFNYSNKRNTMTIVPLPCSALKKGKKRNSWCLMRNFVKGVHLMKFPEIKSIKDEIEFEENLKDEKSSPMIRSIHPIPNLPQVSEALFRKVERKETMSMALEDLRKRERFFSLLQIGGQNSLQELKQYFEADPKKYIRDLNDPESLSNKKNADGESPLYVACRNGHLEVAKFLLEYEANPHVFLERNKLKIDSILLVAARWNFSELVEFLLQKVKWSTEELNFALKGLKRRNSKTRKMIEEVLLPKVRFQLFFKRIFCCFGEN